jgi:hypothetical protein
MASRNPPAGRTILAYPGILDDLHYLACDVITAWSDSPAIRQFPTHSCECPYCGEEHTFELAAHIGLHYRDNGITILPYRFPDEDEGDDDDQPGYLRADGYSCYATPCGHHCWIGIRVVTAAELSALAGRS